MTSIRQLHVEGSHYEIGYEVGVLQRCHLQRIVGEYPYLRQRMVPFVATSEGSKVYRKYLESVLQHYPQYEQEMQGVADGAHVSFQQILLLNLEPEISALLGDGPPADVKSMSTPFVCSTSGCTDIYVNNQENGGFTGIVHSEDVAPFLMNTGVVIDATVTSKTYPSERFTAFTIAGVLPGGLYGFNGYGLIHTANAISPKEVQKHGIPRRILTRAILTATTAEEAAEMATHGGGIASSCSLNLIRCMSDQHEYSVLEMCGNGPSIDISLQSPTGRYFHVNRLKHLKQPEFECGSSIHRAEKIKKIVDTIKTKTDLLRTISNKDDPVFPIYRDGKGPDSLATSSIALFDMKDLTMEVYIGKPDNTLPLLTLPIPRAD